MFLKKIILLLTLFFSIFLSAQEKQFFVKVVVQDKDTRNPIKNAAIFVNGIQFRYSEITRNYKVKAKVNHLPIYHKCHIRSKVYRHLQDHFHP